MRPCSTVASTGLGRITPLAFMTRMVDGVTQRMASRPLASRHEYTAVTLSGKVRSVKLSTAAGAAGFGCSGARRSVPSGQVTW